MLFTRRQWLAAAGVGVAAAAAKRPNVLVVMSDQESALLPGPANLPNRKTLLARGVEFTHAFCNTPQCSAARASLLTGCEPHRAGVLTNVDNSSLGKPLPTTRPTVGTVFQKAGYKTAYFGKWHLGKPSPVEHGFAEGAPSAGSGEAGDDETVASGAAAWIKQQTTQTPWLAWVSLLNPHHIYSVQQHAAEIAVRAGVRPPASLVDNLRSKPVEQQEFMDKDQGRPLRTYTAEQWQKYRTYYLTLVEKIDVQLGVLLKALPDRDNTIIVYTSDHGDALGEHGLPFKGPFMYEEEIRIPLVISGPGAFEKAGKRDDLVTSCDIAPTLAGAAGLSWPGEVDGRDLQKPSGREAVMLEYYAKQKWLNPIRTVRTKEWKLNVYDRGNRELYDLRRDPQEKENLAGKTAAAAVEKKLQQQLDAWRAPLLPQEAGKS